MAMELSWGAWCAWPAFFDFSLCVVALSAALLLARRWPCCGCAMCRAYLTGSWARDFTNLGDWYVDLLRRSSTGTVHVHVLDWVVTASPANIEHILHTHFDNFPKGKPFAAILSDLFGQGIFNVDGDAWCHQGKMASLELGSVVVRSYAYGIVAHEVQGCLLQVLAGAMSAG